MEPFMVFKFYDPFFAKSLARFAQNTAVGEINRTRTETLRYIAYVLLSR